MGKARALLQDRRGAQLIEYLLFVGLVAIAAMGAFRLYGKQLATTSDGQGDCVRDLSGDCGKGPELHLVAAVLPNEKDLGDQAKPPPPAAEPPKEPKISPEEAAFIKERGEKFYKEHGAKPGSCPQCHQEAEPPKKKWNGFNEAITIANRGERFYRDHGARPGTCKGCHGPDQKPPGEKTRTEWQDDILKQMEVTRRDLGGYTDFTLPNQAIMKKVYEYYRTVFKENPDLLWAGMAVLAGRAVWDGQVSNVKGRAWIPSAHTDRIAKMLETELMQMNLKIFLDLGWMHEAYRKKGIKELEARWETGEIDDDTIKAWRLIDQGIKNKNAKDVQAGNKMLLRREQEVILKEGYENIKRIPGNNLGRTMGALAECPIPGGQRFSRVVPGGNMADFKDRWKWIETEMVPLWNDMSPEDRLYYVEQPIDKPLKRK